VETKGNDSPKKMYMAVAAAAAAIVVVLLCILFLRRGEESYRSIKLVELEGSVTIDRDGVGTLNAAANMNLVSGDIVRTAEDSCVVLLLDTDKYVMLGEAGAMTVVAEGDEHNGRTAISLAEGSVLSEIQNPLEGDASFDIVTPNATMSVRGTVFEVRNNAKDAEGNIELLVYDGRVAVELGGQEPAVYEAGEYTKFTAGTNPEFLIERQEITQDLLNEQILERLEQINTQERSLNLGSGSFAVQQDAAVQQESDRQSQASGSQGTSGRPASEKPGETGGSQATEPPKTAEPGAALAQASAQTDRTGAAESTPGASGAAMSSKAPEAGNDGKDNSADTADSGSSHKNDNFGDDGWQEDGSDGTDESGSGASGGNGSQQGSGSGAADGNGSQQGSGNDGTDGSGSGASGGNGGQQGSGSNNGTHGDGGDNAGDDGNRWEWNQQTLEDFWQKYTMEDYRETVSGGDAGAQECMVIFYVPYICEVRGTAASLVNNGIEVHDSQKVSRGALLTEPGEPVGCIDYNWDNQLKFVGWVMEDGTMWNFDTDVVQADVCLFPVWENSMGMRYYPVICRAPEVSFYRCNSIRSGSCLRGLPGKDSFDWMPEEITGWERLNQGGTLWNENVDTVVGVESLRALWGR